MWKITVSARLLQNDLDNKPKLLPSFDQLKLRLEVDIGSKMMRLLKKKSRNDMHQKCFSFHCFFVVQPV